MLDCRLLCVPDAGESEVALWRPSRLGNAAFAWVTVCLGVFALCFAEPARAIPYTLAAAIPITGSESGNPGVVGSLEPVALDGSLSDPLGLTDGDVSFLTNDVFLVRLVLAAGSAPVDSLGIGVNSTPLFGNPVGAGAYADVGQAPSGVTASPVTLMGLFDFMPDTLDAGESSVRLFVTYNPAGSALAVSCSPETEWGLSAAARAAQKPQSRAARTSATSAARSLPVHQLPGFPSSAQAPRVASSRSDRIAYGVSPKTEFAIPILSRSFRSMGGWIRDHSRVSTKSNSGSRSNP